MNLRLSPGATVEPLLLPEFDVTWLGANPIGSGFCFGSEDGRVRFTDEAGEKLGEVRAAASGEAVNGVAYSPDCLAVSTRADISFLAALSGNVEHKVCDFGAFDVISSANGYFVAPLGHDGLMFVDPNDLSAAHVSKTNREGWSFYRAVSLRHEAGKDLLLCAGRRGGIGLSEFRYSIPTQPMAAIRFENLDVVDVCPVGTVALPLAVAAVAKDGTLILVRDMRNDPTPTTLRFDSVRGTAYRLLRSGDDLFILTGRGLTILPDLVRHFQQADRDAVFRVPARTLPVQAFDAEVVDDRWLLIATPQGVLPFGLPTIRDADAGEQNRPVVAGVSVASSREHLDTEQSVLSLAG